MGLVARSFFAALFPDLRGRGVPGQRQVDWDRSISAPSERKLAGDSTPSTWAVTSRGVDTFL